MPSYHLNISFDELWRLSQLYRSTAADLHAKFQQLSSESALIREGWAGSTAAAFQHAIVELESSEQKVVASLESMASLLASASEAINSADQNISSAFDV